MAFAQRRKFQRLKIVFVDAPVSTVVIPPVTSFGALDFSAASQSGLLLLLEDI